jgi:hypothetical protein
LVYAAMSLVALNRRTRTLSRCRASVRRSIAVYLLEAAPLSCLFKRALRRSAALR